MSNEPAPPVHRIYTIAAALLRRGDTILLVEQQAPHDPEPHWSLPGGTVEPGELLLEALARELAEETGLSISGSPSLVYVAQMDRPARREQWTAFIFEIPAWSGDLHPADPDEHIISAEFLPIPVALEKLKKLRWRIMHEPIVAYLEGAAPRGRLWSYREDQSGVETLLHR